MERETDSQGWDLVRKAMEAPNAVAYLSADRVHREAQRLQARLALVKARGGVYRGVDISEDVRALLARLEAGATLSTYVH